MLMEIATDWVRVTMPNGRPGITKCHGALILMIASYDKNIIGEYITRYLQNAYVVNKRN